MESVSQVWGHTWHQGLQPGRALMFVLGLLAGFCLAVVILVLPSKDGADPSGSWSFAQGRDGSFLMTTKTGLINTTITTTSTSAATSAAPCSGAASAQQAQPGGIGVEDSISTAAVLAELERNSANVSENCNQWYGNAMFVNMRHDVVDIFTPGAKTSVGGRGSRASCMRRAPFGIDRFLCTFEEAELVNFQPDYYQKPSVAYHGVEFAVRGCELAATTQNWGWWEKYTAENLHLKKSLSCRQWVEHPVLLYAFWNPSMSNMYESFHDLLSLFEAVLALQWEFRDVELLITNQLSAEKPWKDGVYFPLFDVIRAAFSVRGIRYGHEWYKNGTCFRRIALPPSPGASTLTVNGGRSGQTSCWGPVLVSVRNSIFYLMRESVEPASKAGCQVVLLHRGAGERQVNSNALIAAVTQELSLRNLSSTYTASVFDPVGKPLATALRVMAGTALLFGVHGAGLTHAMFLRHGAALLELFCADRQSSNGHYRTIAALVGLRYFMAEQGTCAAFTGRIVLDSVFQAIPSSSQSFIC